MEVNEALSELEALIRQGQDLARKLDISTEEEAVKMMANGLAFLRRAYGALRRNKPSN